MTNEQEHKYARQVLDEAGWRAKVYASPHDVSAATVAILMHALILATPELTPERRASLFLGDE